MRRLWRRFLAWHYKEPWGTWVLWYKPAGEEPVILATWTARRRRPRTPPSAPL